MRERKEIEKEAKEKLKNSTSAFQVIQVNTELILEILLDVRDILKSQNIIEIIEEKQEEETVEELLPEDDGWKPIAVCGDGLKPDEDTVMHSIGYEKKVNGKKEYKEDFRNFGVKELDAYVKKYSLKVMDETAFNNKFSKNK